MNIRAIRKKEGLTQVEFAKRISMCVMSVKRWESGANKPSPLARKAIELVYGVAEVSNGSK